MRPILAGVETEYGLAVEGRGAEDQISDAMAFVRSYPGEGLALWDYRFESPRSDLRGFKLERLAIDPEDAKFDVGRRRDTDPDVRSDRVLPNGARFYNDHGHPEYSTPECWGLRELALHDAAGELVLQRTADAFAQPVRLYKNNSDYHGASYGTHESYLTPRALGYEALFRAVTPMLVARTWLCGAGKVGSESGPPAEFQRSQRADFFSEPANAETLYRRPVFNTRDEPHADPAEWIRLHVISGDANRLPSCTARKVGLVKLALMLAESGDAPAWELSDPVRAFQSVSRDEAPRIELRGASWTTPQHLLESYLDSAGFLLVRDPLPEPYQAEMIELIEECRVLLAGGDTFRRGVEWAAKRWLLDAFREEEGLRWRDPKMLALDLAWHDLDPDESLYAGMVSMGELPQHPSGDELETRLRGCPEGTRAAARGFAARHFAHELTGITWGGLSFPSGFVSLSPTAHYDLSGLRTDSSAGFVEYVRNLR